VCDTERHSKIFESHDSKNLRSDFFVMENFFRRAEKKLHSQGKGWEGGKGTGENAKKRNKYLQSEKRNTSVFVVCVT